MKKALYTLLGSVVGLCCFSTVFAATFTLTVNPNGNPVPDNISYSCDFNKRGPGDLNFICTSNSSNQVQCRLNPKDAAMLAKLQVNSIACTTMKSGDNYLSSKGSCSFTHSDKVNIINVVVDIKAGELPGYYVFYATPHFS